VKITRGDIAYLETVEDALSRAVTERELEDIRDELAMNGYVGQNGNKKYVQKTKKSEPLTFKTSGGFTVLVGRNNVQNDNLTFKIAAKNDIWFHTKDIPGSHVILVTDGVEPSESDYTEAASIAAHHSKATADTVAVDYTYVKNIKKPQGAKPGFVIYKTNYTAFVRPMKKEELKRNG
jgi:predicted ribosome quality control (RQC) complex YloA/Tae2 family protein